MIEAKPIPPFWQDEGLYIGPLHEPSSPPVLIEDDRAWIKESVESDQIYLDALQALPIRRLTGIRTLGFLTENSSVLKYDGSGGFQHNRFGHVLQVARLLEWIARSNGFSEDLVRHCVVAGLCHDIATPAGGDAIKAIDPKNLDEEKHWRSILTNGARAFFNKYDVHENKIDKIIQNEGILGQLLDIADRIVYTCEDTARIWGAGAAEHLPRLLYQDIKIDWDNDIVYFQDPYRLHEMLAVRAQNHLQMYMNPHNRGTDLIVRALVKPIYSTDGSTFITPDSLRSLRDSELMEFIDSYHGLNYDHPAALQEFLSNLSPEAKTTSPQDPELMLETVNYVKNIDNAVFVGTEELPGFNPGLDYKVLDELGSVVTLKEYFEQRDRSDRPYVLEQIAKTCQAYCIYFIDRSKIAPKSGRIVEALEKVIDLPPGSQNGSSDH